MACAWFCLPGMAKAEDEARRTVEVGGRARTYASHVPAGWDGTSPMPVVVAFHGAGKERPRPKGRQLAELAHLDDLSDQKGFLVLYPDGVLRRWADGRQDSTAEREGVDDLAFVDALLADAATRWPLDASRVYATGFSNGAFFSQRLACTRAERFAAIAVVAGTLAQGLACEPSRPVPVLLFLNTADPVVPWAGGEITGHRGFALGGMADAEMWAQRNGCTGGPVLEPLPDSKRDGTTVTRLRWTGCAAEVVLYRVDGGGHTWPGGEPLAPACILGPTSQDIDASALALEFFQRSPQEKGERSP